MICASLTIMFMFLSPICRCVDVNFFPRDLNAAQHVIFARTSTSQLHTYIYISHNSLRQGISAFTLERRTPLIFFFFFTYKHNPPWDISWAVRRRSECTARNRSLSGLRGALWSDLDIVLAPRSTADGGFIRAARMWLFHLPCLFIYLFSISKLTEWRIRAVFYHYSPLIICPISPEFTWTGSGEESTFAGSGQ